MSTGSIEEIIYNRQIYKQQMANIGTQACFSQKKKTNKKTTKNPQDQKIYIKKKGGGGFPEKRNRKNREKTHKQSDQKTKKL